MDTPETPTPEIPQPEVPKQPSAVEKRIAALYGQAKSEQELRMQSELQANELRSQLSAMQEELTLLKAQSLSQRSAPPAPSAYQTAVPPSSGLDIGELVKRSVQEAVGPVIAGAKQRDEAQQLQHVQQQAYLRATQEFPELSDANSETSKVANRIWSSDPFLKSHPHGPYLAVLAARGALGAPAPAAPASTKIAAGQFPAGTGAPAGGAPPTAAEVAQLDVEIARLEADGKAGRGDPARNWIKLREARIRKATLKADPRLGYLPQEYRKQG